MAETYLTIQEAAEHAAKSIQTIRRALKNKKLVAKRSKTPQGFNYLVSMESLESLYKMKARAHSGIKKGKRLAEAEQTSLADEPIIETEPDFKFKDKFASKEELAEYKKSLDQLISENNKDKETFMRFAKIFQERFTALENQVKLLEAPAEDRKWYQFWK